MRKSLIVLLMILTLSCNFPGFPAIISGKKVTEPGPEVPSDVEEPDPVVDQPEQDPPQVDEPEQDIEDDPTATHTATPSSTPKPTSTDAAPPDEDPTATHTAKPTLTPTVTSTPTIGPTPTKKATATSTPTNTPKIGPPMTFEDPAWELVEWHSIDGTGEWEGTLRARITGGTPPYRSQFENQDIVQGLDMPVRWRLCKPMPATIRVLSADGQDIHKGVWVYEVGCP